MGTVFNVYSSHWYKEEPEVPNRQTTTATSEITALFKVSFVAGAVGHNTFAWGTIHNNLSDFIDSIPHTEETFLHEPVPACPDWQAYVILTKRPTPKQIERWRKQFEQIVSTEYVDPNAEYEDEDRDF